MTDLIRLLELAGISTAPTIVSATGKDGEINRKTADRILDPKGYFEKNKKQIEETPEVDEDSKFANLFDEPTDEEKINHARHIAKYPSMFPHYSAKKACAAIKNELPDVWQSHSEELRAMAQDAEKQREAKQSRLGLTKSR